MEPDPDPIDHKKTTKNAVNPLKKKINKLRNALPQVPRGQSDFFFKEVYQINTQDQQQTEDVEQTAFTSFGYRIGIIPHYLMDLMVAVANHIHCFSEENLRITIEGDQMWIMTTIGHLSNMQDASKYNSLQAKINQSLVQVKLLLEQFLAERKAEIDRNQLRKDTEILDKVEKQLCPLIRKIFKDPDEDD